MKITKKRLKEIVLEEMKLSQIDENSIENLEDELLHNHDGPVDKFVVIYRAIEMAATQRYNVDNLANALYQALNMVGDETLPTGEF